MTKNLAQIISDNPWIVTLDAPAAARAIQALVSERSDGLSEDMTLADFYRLWYRPNVSEVSARHENTIYCRSTAIQYWTRLTGNPPLRNIAIDTINQFVVGMRKQPNGRGGTLAAATINKHCRAVASVLNYAGPPCVQYRQAVGLIPVPPGFPTFKVKANPTAKTPTMDEFRAILDACLTAGCKYPVQADVTPGEWWRAIFLFLYNTGLRKSDVMNAARWSWIRRDQGVISLVVPSDHEKEGIEKVIPISSAARDALNYIPVNNGGVIFEWRYSEGTITNMRQKIADKAGVAREKVTFHAMRRLMATQMDTATARSVLKHVDENVTRNNYQAIEANARALASLPQP